MNFRLPNPFWYKMLVLLVFFGWAGFSFGQQNDFCTTAEPIMCGDRLMGSTIGATPDQYGVCAGWMNSAPGVWYTFTGSNTWVCLSTCGNTSFDTRISLFSGDCGTLDCIASNNDGPNCGNQTSELNFVANAGVQYFVLVTGVNYAEGDFEISMNCSQPLAANDHCQNARSIQCGDMVSGSTTIATADPVITYSGPMNSRGVWYRFQGNGIAFTLSTCSNITNYPSRISVFEGGCPGRNIVAEGVGSCGSGASVSVNTRAGIPYYILVHGDGNADHGDFELKASCPPPPSNDQPCNAIPLSFGSTPFDNTNARRDSGEVSCGIGSGLASCGAQDGWCSFAVSVDNSVWFTFVAPPSGSVDILASGFDTQLALWEVGNCAQYASYQEVAANDDSGQDIDPNVNYGAAGLVEVSCLDPGATYYLQVDGFSGAQGQGQILLADKGTLPLQLNLGGCQTRMIGYAPVEADTNFLVAQASGGAQPYSYQWLAAPDILYRSVDGSGIAVQPRTTTTYTCIVSDARGCEVMEQVKVVVEDIECPTLGGRGSGVTLCRTLPNGRTRKVCVPFGDVPRLLARGDYEIGPCGISCVDTNAYFPPPDPCVNLIFELNTDGLGVDNSWELWDITDSVLVDSRQIGSLSGFTQYIHSYCLDTTHCFRLSIDDRIGDGICCLFGVGSYVVDFNGVRYVSPSGGAFQHQEVLMLGSSCGASKQISRVVEDESGGREMIVFPMPFNDEVAFRFPSRESGRASLEIFSLTGEKVAVIFEGNLETGRLYQWSWRPENLPGGIYFYRMLSERGTHRSGKLQFVPRG